MSRRILMPAAGLALLLIAPAAAVAASGVEVLELDVRGPIGPAVAGYVRRGIDRAAGEAAGLIVLRLDTPGGLDRSMRKIIKAILASPVPVAAYVAPAGARAASAGTYILYAAHIAAMAPATNLGAATPVQIGGLPSPAPKGRGKGKRDGKRAPSAGSSMHRKMVNDAAAYIRALAQLRGRNAEWAEKAVRQAASLTARQALALHVIDLMAEDVPDLLRKLDARTVKTQAGRIVLHTRASRVVRMRPNWRERLLAVITDPNVAYILMLLGIYGLFFELANPGFVLPGVIGGVCLLLALFAFQVLPVNYAGLALMLLGIAFMVTEMFVPSFGALGIGGMIAFAIGSIILMGGHAPPGFSISLGLIIAVTLVSGAFFMAVIGMALKARRRPVVSGREELIGAIGTAQKAFRKTGPVRIHGERWQARTTAPVRKGQPVRVRELDGLTLVVSPIESKEESS